MSPSKSPSKNVILYKGYKIKLKYSYCSTSSYAYDFMHESELHITLINDNTQHRDYLSSRDEFELEFSGSSEPEL